MVLSSNPSHSLIFWNTSTSSAAALSNTADFGSAPTLIRSFSSGSAEYILSDWRDFITTDEYKEMTDAERVKEFRRLKRLAREDARADLWPEQEEQ